MSQLEENVGLTLEQTRGRSPQLHREGSGQVRTEPRPIHRRIEEQAERTPDAIAVSSAGDALSYAELNARANRLARRLRGLGVGPEVLVGLCAGRGVELVVALLGVLKAGGAYVPLDPSYPAERLSFMLEDAAVGLLLTQGALLGKLPATTAKVLCIDREQEGAESEADANFADGVVPGNLAYVIYTSGSTGKPKGVQVTHAALTNLL